MTARVSPLSSLPILQLINIGINFDTNLQTIWTQSQTAQSPQLYFYWISSNILIEENSEIILNHYTGRYTQDLINIGLHYEKFAHIWHTKRRILLIRRLKVALRYWSETLKREVSAYDTKLAPSHRTNKQHRSRSSATTRYKSYLTESSRASPVSPATRLYGHTAQSVPRTGYWKRDYRITTRAHKLCFCKNLQKG